MKKTYEFKNEKYNIIGYTLSEEDDSEKYKTSITYGEESYSRWIISINGKDLVFNNTGNNIVNEKHVIIIDDELNIITDFNYYKIDLNTYKCIYHIELDDLTCIIKKYRNGFLIQMDTSIVYIENDKIIWLFESEDLIDNITILDDDTIKVEEFNENSNIIYNLNKDGQRIG